MVTAIVTAEVVCLLFLLVILWGTLAHFDRSDRPSVLFFISVCAVIFSTWADVLSYMLEYVTDSAPVLYVINVLAIGGTDLTIIPFIYYTIALLNDYRPVPVLCAHIVAITCGFDFFFTAVGAVTGDLFTIENGVFVPGFLYQYNGLVQIVMPLFALAIVLIRYRSIGLKKIIAVGTYFFLPLTAAILFWSSEVSFVYVSLALVMGIIYVSIQSERIEQALLREKLMKEVMNTDPLTGMNNRRAYEAAISSLSLAPDAPVGVIFCDLNGLKKANDNFGHKAGDELILRFAGILNGLFDGSEIFRISGDEFVAVCPGAGAEKFDGLCRSLRSAVENSDDIAAFGAELGSGGAVLELIREAERKMYEDKVAYYAKRGVTYIRGRG